MAAWRVGRLRAALPALATDLVSRVDADLLAERPGAVAELLRFFDAMAKPGEEGSAS